MDFTSKRFWTEGFGSLLVACVIALSIRWAFVEAYVIPSGSMLPSLLVHDHIFVNKLVYGVRVPFTEQWMLEFSKPEKGEVIVFKYPENMDLFYIKRVVGAPGDKVLYENGNLYINNELVEKHEPRDRKGEMGLISDDDFRGEPPGAKVFYTHYEEELNSHNHSIMLRKGRGPISYGPYEVPKGHYFVMGDNRDNSQDSRFWSPEKRFVPEENLIGRAMFVWLSCEKTMAWVPFLCDPRYVRYSRFFHSID